MLDLMNPVTAFGRLVGQAWKLRRDKAKARSAGHARYLTGQACECESACRYNSVEQREHSRIASVVVNVHECDETANRGENFVPKFVSGIEVMSELVSRRDHRA